MRFDKRQLKKIIPIVFLGIALVGAGYFVRPRNVSIKEGIIKVNESIKDKKIVLKDYVRYLGEDRKNAFDLLKKAANDNVEYKQYDFGIFVEGINGEKAPKGKFWKLYHNGQEAQVGADKLETEDGDVIEWRIEDIKT